eukprot:g2496.t1
MIRNAFCARHTLSSSAITRGLSSQLSGKLYRRAEHPNDDAAEIFIKKAAARYTPVKQFHAADESTSLSERLVMVEQQYAEAASCNVHEVECLAQSGMTPACASGAASARWVQEERAALLEALQST